MFNVESCAMNTQTLSSPPAPSTTPHPAHSPWLVLWGLLPVLLLCGLPGPDLGLDRWVGWAYAAFWVWGCCRVPSRFNTPVDLTWHAALCWCFGTNFDKVTVLDVADLFVVDAAVGALPVLMAVAYQALERRDWRVLWVLPVMFLNLPAVPLEGAKNVLARALYPGQTLGYVTQLSPGHVTHVDLRPIDPCVRRLTVQPSGPLKVEVKCSLKQSQSYRDAWDQSLQVPRLIRWMLPQGALP